MCAKAAERREEEKQETTRNDSREETGLKRVRTLISQCMKLCVLLEFRHNLHITTKLRKEYFPSELYDRKPFKDP